MAILETLRGMGISDDTFLRLSFQDTGEGVDFRNEVYGHEIVQNSGIAEMVAELVTTRGLDVFTSYGDNILQNLRTEGYLDDYERGDFSFTSYVADVINENYYDVGVIDVTTERFDYKRGHAHASATLKILAGQAFTLLTSGDFSGWDVTFETQGGHSITINN